MRIRLPLTSVTRSVGLAAACIVTLGGVVGAQKSPPRIPTPADVAAHPPYRSGVILTAQSVVHALIGTPHELWKPAVSKRLLRGASQYAEVAPAVVVVRTRVGHGTGFFVRANGVLVTNNHVIAHGLWHDASGSYAMIHVGRLTSDGMMQLDPNPIRAHVVKNDPAKDLALLKLDTLPSTGLHVLQLAEAAPRPGMSIYIVGHPSSGMLWTYRSGEVSSIGYSPKDLVNIVMPILAASESDRQAARQYLQQSQSEKIMLTTAIANPGDSGGPVVNADGKVVGVTFAVPSEAGEKAFSYHIHRDEVRAFLQEVPSQAVYYIPDPWDIGPRVQLLDLDSDGRPDVLAAGTTSTEEIMFDLTNGTATSMTTPEQLGELVNNRAWHCDFALRLNEGIAFYDRDGDGAIDTILEAGEANPAVAESRFTWSEGRWRFDPYSGNLIDPSLFRDSRAGRLQQLLAALSK